VAPVQIKPADLQQKALGEEETDACVEYRVQEANYDGNFLFFPDF
jgi:hypothetical protein